MRTTGRFLMLVLFATGAVAAEADSVGPVQPVEGSAPATADVSTAKVGGNFRINGINAEVAATPGPAVSGLAFNSMRGEYLVVWADGRNAESRRSDIYARRISAEGKRLGRDIRISDAAGKYSEWGMAVAYDAKDDQYLIAWMDERNHPTTEGEPFGDVYGQVLAGGGALVGPNFQISDDAGYPKYEGYAALTYNAIRDQFLVVWLDSRNWAKPWQDIYGQLIGDEGDLVDNNILISGRRAAPMETPSVAHNTSRDQYLVVWGDERNTATRGADIYGQRLKANGNRIDSNFRISGKAATSGEYSPSVAYNNARSQYLVVWSDSRNHETGSWDVYGQRVAANGTRKKANLRVSRGPSVTGWWGAPAVSYNEATNRYLVVWSAWRNYETRGTDIYGQLLTSRVKRYGNNVRISGKKAIGNDDVRGAAANPTKQEFLVGWCDHRASNLQPALFGQRING